MIYKQIYFGQKREKVKIELTQNSNGQTLVFESMDWDIPAAATCNIYVNKPDGHMVYNGGTVNDNELVFALTEQIVTVPGVAEAQVQIVADDKILNSFILLLDIEETIIDGTAVESTDEYTVLDALITAAQTTISDCEDATQEALDAAGQAREPVQVGARNLVVNTLNPSSSAKPKLKGATDAALNNVTASYSADGLTLNATGSNARYVFCVPSLTDMYCFKAGRIYYFRLKYAGSGTFSVSAQENNPGGTGWEIVAVESQTAGATAQELVLEIDLNNYATGVFVDLSLGSGASILFSEIQLEEATVPAQYRPATEDITTPLLSAVSKLNNLIIAETTHVTTTSNYVILADSSHTGYRMIAAYNTRNDGNYYVYAINRRSSGYTVLFHGVNDGTELDLFTVWAKVG